MTKEEAIVQMKAGNKLTHTYFTPDEWVTILNDKYHFEDGVECSFEEFWSHRMGPAWFFGWEIYKD